MIINKQELNVICIGFSNFSKENEEISTRDFTLVKYM